MPYLALKAAANGFVFGVTATSDVATASEGMPSAAPLVSFQKVGLKACALMPNIGIGTCWFFHCTVGCTPTWEMPVTITSGFLASMLLKIGVKSVVSGEKRMCSTTFNPAFGRQASYPASSGLVQAASSLMIATELNLRLSTRRSLVASQTSCAWAAEVR